METFETRRGFEVLLTLPKGSQVTGLHIVDGELFATSDVGTWKMVRGRMVLVDSSPGAGSAFASRA